MTNMVIAPAFLGETITRQDIVSTLVIVAGCTVAVATANHSDHVYPLEQLFALFQSIGFAVYGCAVVSASLVMVLAIKQMEHVRDTHGRTSSQYLRVYKFHRFSYASVSGIIGAQSVLLAKCIVELLSGSAAGGALFLADWRTYPVLGGLVLAITLQIYYMQLGLAHFDALYCVPVFQCYWILVSVVGGGVFYSEFSEFDRIQSILFPLGVLLCCGGVLALTVARDGDSDGSKGIGMGVAGIAGDGDGTGASGVGMVGLEGDLDDGSGGKSSLPLPLSPSSILAKLASGLIGHRGEATKLLDPSADHDSGGNSNAGFGTAAVIVAGGSEHHTGSTYRFDKTTRRGAGSGNDHRPHRRVASRSNSFADSHSGDGTCANTLALSMPPLPGREHKPHSENSKQQQQHQQQYDDGGGGADGTGDGLLSMRDLTSGAVAGDVHSASSSSSTNGRRHRRVSSSSAAIDVGMGVVIDAQQLTASMLGNRRLSFAHDHPHR